MGSLSYSDKKSPTNTATRRTTVIDFQPQERSRQVLPRPMPYPETNNQMTPEPPKKGQKTPKETAQQPPTTYLKASTLDFVGTPGFCRWMAWVEILS